MLTPRVKKLFVVVFGLLGVAVLLMSVVAVSAAGVDAKAARTSKGNPAPLAVQGCAGASFAAAANFGTGTSPISVTTADFNKDGNLDLAVANFFADTVSVLPGNGTGGFGTKVDFATGSRPFSVITADFNKDGNFDLAVSNLFSSSVSVLYGNGAGSFAPKVDFITGGDSRGLTTADFNKDGNLDLAVATQNSTVAVLLNNGAGGFATRVEYPAGTTTFFVTAGDFNEDGNPDLAVANQDSNNVSVLLGNGAVGGFAPKVDYAAGTGPRYVLTSDFNNDGNLDLAVANLGSNNISVLLGNGTGSFAPKVDYAATSSPFSLATADFNRDGNLDLAAANNTFSSNISTTISVLLGDGAGGFAPKVDFTVGTNPFSLAAGDFNKDGSPDLAVANFDSNNVSVLINSCVIPNNVPVASASPNPATTNEDTPVTITLTGNDADDQNLDIIVTDLPDHGTLDEPVDTGCTPPGSAATICTRDVIYTPNPNYNGTDSFKFKVNDGIVDSPEVTVNINVNAVIDLSISDVTQAEGNAGATIFIFTVSLDSPAPAQGVTFNIATQDGTATDANNDYEPYSETGSIIFEGQTEYLFTVTVNGDTTDEPNETFFVNVTNANGATISDGQGTGTILNDDGPPSAGQIIISEFRLRGAGADSANDEFIEIYNNTDVEVVVSDSSPLPDFNPDGWAIVSSDDPTTAKHIIPIGTRIPARGHYLVANTLGYSLGLYPAGYNVQGAATTAIENGGYNVDIPDNAGVALFRTGNPLLFLSPAERLDAVGFTASPLFAETTPLQPATGVNIPLQHSFVRRMTTGRPQDTDNNQNDFDFVAVSQTTVSGRTPLLGAPGPENLTSPTQRNAVVKAQLVDPLCAGAGAPETACARVRTAANANPTNAAFGTLLIRRRFRNTSSVDVTRLRFRLVDVTAGTPTGGLADLRALSSVDVTVTNTQGFDVLLHGLTLEEVSTPAPTQPGGGGLNSTLSADVTLAQPLKPNVPYDVEFRLGVMVNGNFRFLVNVEALPPASPAPAATGKTPHAARGKHAAGNAAKQ